MGVGNVETEDWASLRGRLLESSSMAEQNLAMKRETIDGVESATSPHVLIGSLALGSDRCVWMENADASIRSPPFLNGIILKVQSRTADNEVNSSLLRRLQ